MHLYTHGTNTNTLVDCSSNLWIKFDFIDAICVKATVTYTNHGDSGDLSQEYAPILSYLCECSISYNLMTHETNQLL